MTVADKKFLELRRLPNGNLIPCVEGVPLEGFMSAQINTDREQGILTVSFHCSGVFFLTEPNTKRAN